MATRVDRRTVDLSAYPDLVVIYLGLRANALAGLKMLLGLGPGIRRSRRAAPAIRDHGARPVWRDR
jgi:hypothetical protein